MRLESEPALPPPPQATDQWEKWTAVTIKSKNREPTAVIKSMHDLAAALGPLHSAFVFQHWFEDFTTSLDRAALQGVWSIVQNWGRSNGKLKSYVDFYFDPPLNQAPIATPQQPTRIHTVDIRE